jgi:hypothetical protein
VRPPLLPIVGLPCQKHSDARIELGQVVSACPDRALPVGQAVLLWHDDQMVVADDERKIHVWQRQLEDDGILAIGPDIDDLFDDPLGRRRRFAATMVVDRRNDVLSAQRLAVVELDVLSEPESPGLRVCARIPTLRQLWNGVIVGIEFGEIVVDPAKETDLKGKRCPGARIERIARRAA